jgi:hypothetical protein
MQPLKGFQPGVQALDLVRIGLVVVEFDLAARST